MNLTLIFCAGIFWDHSKVFFTIPFIDHPITWYGTLFALGFFSIYLVCFNLFFQLLKDKERARVLLDRLTTYIIFGTLIGMRVGHILFYEPKTLIESPWSLLKIWEGGLASHGGALGVLVALLLFCKKERKLLGNLNFFSILDVIAVATGLLCAFIRVGNFINQEILGTPTDLPWGVIFFNPVQKVDFVPLHPVQLYEAIFYLFTFIFLFSYWKKKEGKVPPGMFSGLFLILIFTFRLFIEKLKMPQSEWMNESFITMGQILSIPFILLGIGLLLYSLKKRAIV